MKINYLILNNIGPYVGNNKFILDTNSSKNIILIGGKNGAGKTSFLRGMKYGLFGSFALGLKTNSDMYFNEIKSLINNKTKDNYYIEISFDYIENFETYNYVMRRSWNWNNGNLEETLKIKSNGENLNDYEIKEISDKIRAMTSPQLINSFIFDGEKISNIIENGEVAKYLEETFNSIFSLDLITQTQRDLENYLLKKADESQSKEQIDSINLITKINSLKNQIKSAENDLTTFKTTCSNLYAMKKSNSDNFYKLGGLTKSQQEKFSKKLDEFIKEKEEMNRKVRNYIETDLPLFLCKDLLSDAVLQCRYERQAKYPMMLDEIEQFMNCSFKEIREKLMLMISDCKTIQNLELPQLEFIHNRLDETLFYTQEIKPYINSKILKTDEYKQIKKNLINNENTETIDKLIDENKKIDLSIHELEITIKNQVSLIESLNEELQMSYAIFEKVNDDLKKKSLYDSSFNMGKSALNLCEIFKSTITKNKLKDISKTALDIFNDTIRKNEFISGLSINTKFELKLKNSHGISIDPKTLSAGEMQILVSSLIWAMFRISGRREMFIFDTPLARLDNENRYNFITKIISTISSQVVILSTDSEFVGENLKVINSHIFKKYLLEYNVENNATTVLENYFGGNN